MSKEANLTANGHSPTGNFCRESLGFSVAEGVSFLTSLGVVAVAEDLAPKLVSGASKAIAKMVVEPYLDTIEWGMTNFCRLEECQPDLTKSRQERAEKVARAIVLFAPAWATSMLFKIKTRQYINERFNIGDANPYRDTHVAWHPKRMFYTSPMDRKVLACDELTHYGAFIVMNSVGHKLNDRMIHSLSGVLHKTLGWSEQKAHDVASMAVIWELSNAVGTMAGIGAIAQKYKIGPFKDKTAIAGMFGSSHQPGAT